MIDEPNVGTPAARMRGRCSCGDEAVIRFEGEWCAVCALFIIDAAPAVAYFELLGEPLPKRGIALREKVAA